MQLIVAEKPSVARDLARVLGVRASGRNCFEGDRFVITWCVGHLVELDEPAAYDARWRAWRLDALPMLPSEFRLRAAKHAADQLRAVTRLLRDRRFTGVVNACDAGREGELIFRYLCQYAGARLPVQRLWISSLTDDAIRRGFAALRPGAQLDALADAARSRSEADWLVGMNATRGITARGRDAGHDALYSIGRVQTPTLAMLVERERAIERFVPRTYWELRAELTTADGERFTAQWRRETTRIGAAGVADAIVGRDTEHAAAADPIGPRVERIRARTVREPPPLLFDLTALQRTANRRFGWPAARTLELAQALYERHKRITYPRTDSRYLSSDVAGELGRVFAALAAEPDYQEHAGALVARPVRPGRRVVDDAKVSDHHAIIPTASAGSLAALDRDERRLFDLIARRFLGAFYPDAEFAVTEAWIRVLASDGGVPPFPAESRPGARPPEPGEPPMLEALPPPPDRYLARGRVRVIAGWQAVAGIEGGERSDEHAATLPRLVEGQALDGTFSAVEKQTRPPPRFTDATLLSAMETAGRSIDDEALRDAMKDRGLGTPATRAAIIETLLRRAYIVRDRQALVPTAMGSGLIESLPVASLASPELTGAWEARLARIARGEESRAAFMADIARYVRELIDAIRAAGPPPPPPAGLVQQTRRGKGGRDRWRGPGRGAKRGAGEPARARRSAGSQGGPRGARSQRGERRYPAVEGRGREPARDVPDARDDRREPTELERRRDAPDRDVPARQPDRSPTFRPPPLAQSDRELRAGIDDLARAFEQILERSIAPVEPDVRGGRCERTPSSITITDPGTTEGGAIAATSSISKRPRTSGGSRTRASRTSSRPATPRAGRPRSPRAPGRSGSPGRTGELATAPSPKRGAPIAPSEIACPRCTAGTLLTGTRGWGCSRWREGCRFVVWFETAGRRLTAAQLRDLVTRGKTRKGEFRPDGTPRDGHLVLDPNLEGGARFTPADVPARRSRR